MDLRLIAVIGLHVDLAGTAVDNKASIQAQHAGLFQIQAPLLQEPGGIGLENNTGADLVCGLMAFVDCDDMTCSAKWYCTRKIADAAANDDDVELNGHICLGISLCCLEKSNIVNMWCFEVDRCYIVCSSFG